MGSNSGHISDRVSEVFRGFISCGLRTNRFRSVTNAKVHNTQISVPNRWQTKQIAIAVVINYTILYDADKSRRVRLCHRLRALTHTRYTANGFIVRKMICYAFETEKSPPPERYYCFTIARDIIVMIYCYGMSYDMWTFYRSIIRGAVNIVTRYSGHRYMERQNHRWVKCPCAATRRWFPTIMSFSTFLLDLNNPMCLSYSYLLVSFRLDQTRFAGFRRDWLFFLNKYTNLSR